MAGQREQIGQHLQALYTSGTQSPLQVLLDQSHAEQVSRHLRYYDYLVAARRDKMSRYLQALQQKRSLEQQVLQSLQELKSLQVVSEQEQAALLGLRDERRQLLAGLDSDLADKDSELKRLERDRVALQKVIDQIEKQRALAIALEQKRQAEALKAQQEKAEQEKAEQETARLEKAKQEAVTGNLAPSVSQAPETSVVTVSDNTVDTSSAGSGSAVYSTEDLDRLQATAFPKRKGLLPWPVRGSLANRFGEQRQGSVTWEGVRIRAQAGSDVRAVHYGRVMYADWLRGQGMLLILDHGDGFMSLYAHNDVLLRSAGEWVQAGDAIARVGNSGGEKESGLYFEIRQNGQTVDPSIWLGKK